MELQIIRTRHPPEAYYAQFADLNTLCGFDANAGDIRGRVIALQRGNRLLLALDGESLLGYAHLRVVQDLIHGESVEVVTIVVHPNFRRRGIGRRLIAAAESWAQQSGSQRLVLHTDVVQADAHAFFVALGYDKNATLVEFVRNLDELRRADAPTIPP